MQNLKRITKLLTLLFTLLLFLFALLSGAELYGGGISGIIQNSPNALPWAVLAVLILALWKKERAQGVIYGLVGLLLMLSALSLSLATDTYGTEVIFCLIALVYLVSSGLLLFGTRKP